MNQSIASTSTLLNPQLPARFDRITWKAAGLILFGILILVLAILLAGFSMESVASAGRHITQIPSLVAAPDLLSLYGIFWAALVTASMILASQFFGLLIGVPLGFLSSHTQAPWSGLSDILRPIMKLFRTIPELIWALLLVTTLGTGPLAGTLALLITVIGYCSSIFAQAIEHVDPAPSQALQAIGASRLGILFSASIPAIWNLYLISSIVRLEKLTRAAMLIGLIGAGGLGFELRTTLENGRFFEAAIILTLMLLAPLLSEKISSLVRIRLA